MAAVSSAIVNRGKTPPLPVFVLRFGYFWVFSLRLKHKSLEHETCSVSAILVYDLSPLTREFLCWIYKLMNSSRAAPYRPLVFLGPSTFYAMPLFMIDNYAALI